VRVAELAPGDIFAGYHVLSQLGEGGMGIVYLAEHIGLGRKVALKLLPPQLASDPRFRERFIRESRTAASLDHPNVIPIYEAGEADGRLFLAMRYVDGTDLNRILHDQGRLEPTRALRILKQVAGALDAAHERGLVHRDVKPANVMLTAGSGTEEHVYLTDFGLTKRMASESGITDTGQFVGSLDYAAPEQFEGGTLTPATDLYSLGAVLYECLTGEAPFRREQDAAVMFAHLLAPVPKVTDSRAELLPGIDQVLARAMAKKPDERYASGAQLVTAAADALGLHGEEYRIPTSRLRRIVGARRSRRRRRFTLTAVAVALVVALMAVVLPRFISGGGTALERDPAGMALLDTKTGSQQGFIPLSAVKTPAEAIFADGHFWVLNLDPLSFVEIDPKTGAILRQIASPVPDIGFYTVDGNDLWLTADSHPILVKVDVRLGREVDRFTLSDAPGFNGGFGGPLVADGSVWVGGESAVLRIDPETGKVQQRLPNLPYAGPIVFGDGSIWTNWGFPHSGLVRIDPKTNTVGATAKIPPPGPVGSTFPSVAAGGGFGWTADELRGVVHKVDAHGNLVATYTTGEGARAVSYADGVLWVGNQDVGTVSGIDALTGEETTYRFDHPIQAVAAGSGSLLVQLNRGRTYEDRIDSLQGKVAKFFIAANQLPDPDPSTSQSTLANEVEFATCAKLLNYPDKPAPEGFELQPEVAASMPQISADGRTYTFAVRSGYRFSPPSNQVVTAETFRYSIERALSPKLGEDTPGPSTIGDIEGEEAFLAGKADHISGLQAQGNELTISLTHPSPDFLVRMAAPFFCPVPRDTAIVPRGAVTEVRESGTSMVPSAGPYYIADAFNGEYMILKRNPNYSGPRPHALDAIALREGIDPGQEVARVRNASWDGITNLSDPIMSPYAELAKAWGPGGAAAAKNDQRYYAFPDGSGLYLQFNSGRSLFADRSVREAAAYALDRPALARAFEAGFFSGGGAALPTDQLLPTNWFGPRTSTFPLDGPDLAKANALMHGRKATAILVASGSNDGQVAQAEEVKTDLARIGIDVRIKKVDSSFEAISQPGAPYDLKVGGNNFGYLNPTAYLTIMFAGDPPGLPDEWQPRAIQAAVATLRRSPTESGFVLLEGAIMTEIPETGIAYTVQAAFFAPRIGCRIFPPASYGVDLAALCVTGASP
jgi:ABC-type transport system substrate-binding protein